MDSLMWDDKCYVDNVNKRVTHGKCIGIKNMSSEELKSLMEDLKKCGVHYTIRPASSSTEHIKKGEEYLAVTDPRSVYNLYENYFQYTIMSFGEKNDYSSYGHILISESLDEYNKRKQEENEADDFEAKELAAYEKNPAGYIASSADQIAQVLKENPEMQSGLLRYLMEKKFERKQSVKKPSLRNLLKFRSR